MRLACWNLRVQANTTIDHADPTNVAFYQPIGAFTGYPRFLVTTESRLSRARGSRWLVGHGAGSTAVPAVLLMSFGAGRNVEAAFAILRA